MYGEQGGAYRYCCQCVKGEGHTVIAVICMSFFITGSDEEDEELFSWEEYLKKYHAKAVPKETFKHVSINTCRCTSNCKCFFIFTACTRHNLLTLLLSRSRQ